MTIGKFTFPSFVKKNYEKHSRLYINFSFLFSKSQNAILMEKASFAVDSFQILSEKVTALSEFFTILHRCGIREAAGLRRGVIFDSEKK